MREKDEAHEGAPAVHQIYFDGNQSTCPTVSGGTLVFDDDADTNSLWASGAKRESFKIELAETGALKLNLS